MKTYQSIFLLLLVTLVLSSNNLFSQEEEKKFESSGNVYGLIFTNFHSDFSGENSAFEIQRAYLGYKHQIDNHFSANIKLDIATHDNDELKRYAYFKNALITYTNKNVRLNFGLIDVYMFKTQEKFFGKRYIYKSFLDKNKFGASADLGASFLYTFNGKLNLDFAVLNGEGYSNIQLDNTYQAALGLSYNPIENLYSRLYFDYSKKTYVQATYSAFLGYKQAEKFSIGVEYNYQSNRDFTEDHNSFGYSVYGTLNIAKKWELFARYDDLGSNKITGEENNWNISKDGNTIISGLQYSPVRKVKLALNYQGFISDDADANDISAIYLNIEYKF